MSCVPGLTLPRPAHGAAQMTREAARDAAQVTYVFRAEDYRWDLEELDRLSMHLDGARVFPGESQGKPNLLAILGNYSAGQVTTALGYKTFERTEVFQGLDNQKAPFPIDERVWPIEPL